MGKLNCDWFAELLHKHHSYLRNYHVKANTPHNHGTLSDGPHKASQPTLTHLSEQLNAPLPPGLYLPYLTAYALITSSQPDLCLSITSTVIYMSSGARINVTNAIGGFLHHSNEDIRSIYGVSSPSSLLATGIQVAAANLEKLSKSEAVLQTQAGGRGIKTIAGMGVRLQHNRLSKNSISPHKEVLPLQCINALIQWCCLFLYEVSITVLALSTSRQKNLLLVH